MSVKFFCKCRKEIWGSMSTIDKKTTTIAEAEKICICSDCTLEEGRKKNS